jgi:hypothetical protein
VWALTSIASRTEPMGSKSSRVGTNVPAFARYFHLGGLTAVLHYDLYLTKFPNDPSLFLPPSNVRYSEAGSD